MKQIRNSDKAFFDREAEKEISSLVLSSSPYRRLARSVAGYYDLSGEFYNHLLQMPQANRYVELKQRVAQQSSSDKIDSLRDYSVNSNMRTFALQMARLWKRVQDRYKIEIKLAESWEDVLTMFGEKVPLTKEEWLQIEEGLRNKYFYISRAEEQWMVEEVQNYIMQELSKGTSWDTVKESNYKSFTDVLGMTELSPGHLNFIVNQNSSSSAMASHYKLASELSDYFPCWLYTSALKPTSRPWHIALHGKIFQYGSPESDSVYPPNDWGCLCSAIALPYFENPQATDFGQMIDVEGQQVSMEEAMQNIFNKGSKDANMFRGNPFDNYFNISSESQSLYNRWLERTT